MAKKKKKNIKIHIKPGVRNLGIFFGIVFILGLIFMNFTFTVILILGMLFIMWISNIMVMNMIMILILFLERY